MEARAFISLLNIQWLLMFEPHSAGSRSLSHASLFAILLGIEDVTFVETIQELYTILAVECVVKLKIASWQVICLSTSSTPVIERGPAVTDCVVRNWFTLAFLGKIL